MADIQCIEEHSHTFKAADLWKIENCVFHKNV